jgi:hypothetical protein
MKKRFSEEQIIGFLRESGEQRPCGSRAWETQTTRGA